MPYDEDEVPDPFQVLVNQIRQRIIDNWVENHKNDYFLWISVDDIEGFAEALCLFGEEGDAFIRDALAVLSCEDQVPPTRGSGYLEYRRVTRDKAKAFKRKFIERFPVEPIAASSTSSTVNVPAQPRFQDLSVDLAPNDATEITYTDANGVSITVTGVKKLTAKGVVRFTFGLLLLGLLVGIAVLIV